MTIFVIELDDDVTGEEAQKEGKALSYDLFGVVNHYGNMGFGHYTAYAMNHQDKNWYTFDDSSVTPEKADSVCTPAAYVLFYRRKDWDHSKIYKQ
jgi:ubiquitin C-terminal hydrolase